MNLAEVIDPRTGHIDADRVAYLDMFRDISCGRSLDELLAEHRIVIRKHVRQGPPGQGRNPEYK